MTRVAAAEVSSDREMMRRAVVEHGASTSFGFGRGVVVPHAVIPGVVEPIGVFARLSPAKDFGASDEIPADLAFLLLSPMATIPRI